MKKTLLILFVLFLILPATSLFAGNAGKSEAAAVKAVWEKYIQAMENSDIKTLFTTISEKNDFLFLTSRGEAIKNREGYYRFHEEWFKEKGWEMPTELMEVHAGRESMVTQLQRMHSNRRRQMDTSMFRRHMLH